MAYKLTEGNLMGFLLITFLLFTSLEGLGELIVLSLIKEIEQLLISDGCIP